MRNKNNDKNFIIAAYSFDEKKNANLINLRSVEKMIQSRKLSWVHLDGNNPRSREFVEKNAPKLDKLMVDALFAEETRPRILEFTSGMLVILRSTSFLPNGKYEIKSVRMWVSKTDVISVQMCEFFSPIVNIINNIESKNLAISATGDILFNLINEISLSCNKLLDIYDEKLDKIEEELFEDKIFEDNSNNNKIMTSLKKEISSFKRYIMPQKEVLNLLQTSKYKWIDDLAIRNFQEGFNQTCLLIEEIDEIKNRLQIIHQDLASMNDLRINRSLYKITLIASIFLPLSFVASIFGMNVGGIPLSNNQFGFQILSYFMAIVFGALYLLIRKKK